MTSKFTTMTILITLTTILWLSGTVYGQTTDSLNFSPPKLVGADDLVLFETQSKRHRILRRNHLRYQGVETAPYFGSDLQGLSFNFSDLVPVDDPTQWPARANVHLLLNGGDSCSGMMIGPRHVLTAAHCVYSKADGFVTEIQVSPLTLNYGISHMTSVVAFKGYTKWQYWNYDIALVTLDRPIGALTGWYGYGTASCWQFTHDDWENYAVPQEGPLAGEFTYWGGEFDWCPNSKLVQVNNSGYKGMSGSGVSRPGEYIARGVASHKYQIWPKGTRYVRITNSTGGTFHDVINNQLPNQPDLIPIGFKLHDDSINLTPELGDSHIEISGVNVFNDSKTTWNDQLTLHVKLSSNDDISSSDKTIWSHTGIYQIDPLKSLPFSPMTIDMTGVEAGVYYIGLWLEADDLYSGNNDGDDAILNELDWLIVNNVDADLEVTELDVTSGSYADFQSPTVTFSVTNSGDLGLVDKWTAMLYVSQSSTFGDDAILVSSGASEPLGVGEQVNDSVGLTLYNLPPGTYWTHLVVSTNEPETTQLNNHKRSADTFTISAINDFAPVPPDLYLNYVALVSGSYSKSESLPVTFSLANSSSTNAGQWTATFYAVNSQGTIETLASGQSPALASGASYASTKHLPLANLAAGTWWVAMTIEAEEEVDLGDNTGFTPTAFEVVNELQLGE